jgi:translation initiation factor 3 subunit A
VALKARTAKEGLGAYKNFADPSSIDKVTKHFISLASKRVEEAWQQTRGSSTSGGAVVVEDLEEIETPESVLMAAVSEEGSQERQDRVLLTPWLKFLWETYRTVIDILRNNNKLESLYHVSLCGALKSFCLAVSFSLYYYYFFFFFSLSLSVTHTHTHTHTHLQSAAKEAFGFCLKYDRKHEFRRLCDILRKNLQDSMKYKEQAHSISLKSPESLHLHLEVRFEQFRVAGKLGLWQEAFKTIEDICSVIELSGQTPKFNDLSRYFNYLASALWRSNDFNFHAATWHKIYMLTQEQRKTLSAETLQQVCTNVLLATLCIPIASNDTEVKKVDVFCKDAVKVENQLRLVGLIGIASVPTRKDLIADMLAMNILANVDPEVKCLFSLLEEQFAPLQLCQKIKPVFDFLEKSEHLSQYVKPLQYVVVMRVLKQVCARLVPDSTLSPSFRQKPGLDYEEHIYFYLHCLSTFVCHDVSNI